ncbi:MAG: glycerate dehydrogenase [Mogibacterium sp.]|nr:glycerate dehydrogenase [Mogibacterium sp.]
MPTVVCSLPESRFEKYSVSWPEGWNIKYIERPIDENGLREMQEADYLLVDCMDRITREMLEPCKKLKMLHVEGVSFNMVDIEGARELGIMVCNNKAVNAAAVAEHCAALMLAGYRKVGWMDHNVRRFGYAKANELFVERGVREVEGSTIGMIGMGVIGREVAKRLAPWGCRLVYTDPVRMDEELEKAYGLEYVTQEELMRESDIISIHVPVLPSTINMINRETLSMMKNDVLLVNVARGEIVNNDDLAWALEAHEIGFAALDTVAPEPMPDDHPLRNLRPDADARVLFTTHSAGRTDQAFKRMLEWAIASMKKMENGERPNNIVNGL